MGGLLTHCNSLERKKWDDLVDSDPNALIFNKSFYLDEVCKDWYVFHDVFFKYGIVICSIKKMGVRQVYPPFFHRYSDIVGDNKLIDFKSFERILLQNFPIGLLQVSSQLSFKNITEGKQLMFQELLNPVLLSKQATRKINKIKKKYSINLEEKIQNEKLLDLIFRVLKEKLPFFKTKESEYLKGVISKAHKNNQLISIGAFVDGQLVGGLFGLKYHNRVIYLKGACYEDYTKDGMMYYLMHNFSQKCLSEGFTFDFGGSNIDGVRYFNQKLGGTDVFYNSYSWDNSPKWFRLLRKIKHAIK